MLAGILRSMIFWKMLSGSICCSSRFRCKDIRRRQPDQHAWHGRPKTMPWHIGVDEAGYGPNLGPFVMTAVACRLPEDLLDANLWQALRSTVRRRRHKPDGRLLIDDSKLVYTSPEGLGGLEAAALAVHRLADDSSPCLHAFIEELGADPA